MQRQVEVAAMKQPGQGWPQQQPTMQPPPNVAPGFGAYPPAFWNPGMPAAFNPQCYPVFDPSGFYPAPSFGWNGNPWTLC